MLKIREYVKAESLEQAYELNQKKSNQIIGGMLWLKLQDRMVQTAIDLSGLGLDTIEETEEAFTIGCMVTLRDLETHAGLNAWSKGAFKASVRDIVGVQFRNLATVGGSLFGRFGFSDVCTLFLALDTYVELYAGGLVPFKEFITRKWDRDLLVRVIVRKTKTDVVYLTHRNTKTDFPVLAVAVAKTCEGGVISVGARPARAMQIVIEQEWMEGLLTYSEEDLGTKAEEVAARIPTGTNMRASAEFRTHLAKVLIRRALKELKEREGQA